MNYLYDAYQTYWYKYADQRILEYPFYGSPIPMILVLILYGLLLKKGPRLMANRPPYDIKNVIQVYNVFQILINSFLFSRGMYLILQKDYRCLMHNTVSQHDLDVTSWGWMYVMMKIIDLCDTLFFTLRKRFDLVSTLHVYHHVMMVIGTWLPNRYISVGEMAILGICNSFVHSVMYFYYFYCLHGGRKGPVWWKKYITQLQIVQFVFFVLYFKYKLFFAEDCDYPKPVFYYGIFQASLILYMFSNYYYNAHIKKKKALNAKEAD